MTAPRPEATPARTSTTPATHTAQMNVSQQTDAPPAPTPAVAPQAPAGPSARAALAWVLARPALRHLALTPVLALSAVLNVHRLSQNGYANIFYSAGVKSMLHSLHNFAFVSFDPGGLVMVDKPPLGLWLQAASAKLFGFSPLSLLLPEAIIGVLTVALLYYVVQRRFGWLAALASALALAVFPSFVAVSRDNGVDPLLILLMALACATALWSIESGRLSALLCSAVLVGLAFNTKTLAAYLVLPGIAIAYVVCAPGSIKRRVAQLALAGSVMLVVSFSWIAFVELTPASKRPFVGGSTNNTELGLTFEYNGFGRVGGQVGGPGRVPFKAGAIVHSQRVAPVAKPGLAGHAPRHRARRAPARHARPAEAVINANPKAIPFGSPPSPVRLWGKGLGDQGGWLIPLALFGSIALACLLALAPPGASSRRRDPRLAALLVLGGWFWVEAIVLSLSKGIVHPYYVSALAPGTAAMAGAGAVAFAELAKRGRRDWRRLIAPTAVLGTVAVEIVLLHREHYMHWFVPLLLLGGAAATAALLWLRRPSASAWTVVAALALLLVAPAAYSTTTWHAPVEGTFPAAGPRAATGRGGVGLPRKDVPRERLLINYVLSHGPGKRWTVLFDASNTAAPLILLGHDAGAVAGYSGTDPAVDGRRLARLVARHEARYVVLGGEFSTRGGNGATAATIRSCREVPPTVWQGAPIF
ncbi:MAG TPA: glycosyltransferase family 39 protein, partial [Solirubrobacteraceae bacterium]|nr:glycosyltransferase family 39 protein [Solirubrobacteraceae bacterium]